MSFNIFDGLDFLADLLSLDFSSKSESVNSKKKEF